jgi:hypothetical protein
MGADVGSVLKEVGLTEDEGVGEERVWLHCIVGARLDEKKSDEVEEEEVCPLIIQSGREADGSRMLQGGEDSMCCLILDSRLMMSLICVGSSISPEEKRCQKV